MWRIVLSRTRVAAIALAAMLATLISVNVSAASVGPNLPADTVELPGITHGVHLRPTYNYGNELNAVNALVGGNAGLLMYFAPWSPFDGFLLNQIQDQVPASERPVVVLSWEPGPSSTGCNLGYGGVGPLTAIAQGNCDSYIWSFATALKARPERFILRLGHEMNIADTPWWPGHYGSGPSQYVAMWRRVHGIFDSVGADNVEWAWSPNYASNPYDDGTYAWNDIHSYYPGDAYVDWIGLSGYNWGSPWRTFEEIYDEVLRDMTCSYAKPQLLLEIGTVDGGGGTQTKATWMTDMYSSLPEYPFVRGVAWFNDFAHASRGHADFRITTSTADCTQYGDCSGVQPISNWTSAYASAIASPSYQSALPSLADATPVQTMCVLGDQLTVTPSRALDLPGGTTSFNVLAFGVSEPMYLTADPADAAYFRFPPSPMFLSSISTWDSVEFTVQSYITTPLRTYDFSLEVAGYSIPLAITVVDEIYTAYLPMAMLSR